MRLTVRFADDDVKLLKKVTGARREDISSFIRRAVRRQFAELGLLSREESQALGVRDSR